MDIEVGADTNLLKPRSVYMCAGYLKNNGSATASWPGVSVTEPGTKRSSGCGDDASFHAFAAVAFFNLERVDGGALAFGLAAVNSSAWGWGWGAAVASYTV